MILAALILALALLLYPFAQQLAYFYGRWLAGSPPLGIATMLADVPASPLDETAQAMQDLVKEMTAELRARRKADQPWQEGDPDGPRGS